MSSQPLVRANAQLTRKLHALPKCNAPVGDGANRDLRCVTRPISLLPNPPCVPATVFRRAHRRTSIEDALVEFL